MSKLRHYILADKKVVPCDLMTWVRWMETGDRIVAADVIGGILVSTVFLGIDHSFGNGPPLLFETMLFDGPTDNELMRCSTYEQAEAQHRAAVDAVRELVDESVLAMERLRNPQT